MEKRRSDREFPRDGTRPCRTRDRRDLRVHLREQPQKPLRETLTQVLGAERAAQYQQAKEQLNLETQQEEDQAELFALSRKLQLSPEQERSVQGVIAALRKELAPLQSRIETFGERATLLHSAPKTEQTQSDLRNLYEEMKTVIQQTNETKRAAMREQLRSVLSDDQLNQLILLQEKERNQFFEGE